MSHDVEDCVKKIKYLKNAESISGDTLRLVCGETFHPEATIEILNGAKVNVEGFIEQSQTFQSYFQTNNILDNFDVVWKSKEEMRIYAQWDVFLTSKWLPKGETRVDSIFDMSRADGGVWRITHYRFVWPHQTVIGGIMGAFTFPTLPTPSFYPFSMGPQAEIPYDQLQSVTDEESPFGSTSTTTWYAMILDATFRASTQTVSSWMNQELSLERIATDAKHLFTTTPIAMNLTQTRDGGYLFRDPYFALAAKGPIELQDDTLVFTPMDTLFDKNFLPLEFRLPDEQRITRQSKDFEQFVSIALVTFIHCLTFYHHTMPHFPVYKPMLQLLAHFNDSHPVSILFRPHLQQGAAAILSVENPINSVLSTSAFIHPFCVSTSSFHAVVEYTAGLNGNDTLHDYIQTCLITTGAFGDACRVYHAAWTNLYDQVASDYPGSFTDTVAMRFWSDCYATEQHPLDQTRVRRYWIDMLFAQSALHAMQHNGLSLLPISWHFKVKKDGSKLTLYETLQEKLFINYFDAQPAHTLKDLKYDFPKSKLYCQNLLAFIREREHQLLDIYKSDRICFFVDK